MPGIVIEVSAILVLMMIFLVPFETGEKISIWLAGSAAAYNVWIRKFGPTHSGFYEKQNMLHRKIVNGGNILNKRNTFEI